MKRECRWCACRLSWWRLGRYCRRCVLDTPSPPCKAGAHASRTEKEAWL